MGSFLVVGFVHANAIPLTTKPLHRGGTCAQTTPKKRRSSERRILMTGKALNIDIRGFQGILFDKGTARFNRIAHQGSE